MEHSKKFISNLKSVLHTDFTKVAMVLTTEQRVFLIKNYYKNHDNKNKIQLIGQLWLECYDYIKVSLLFCKFCTLYTQNKAKIP